MYKILKFESWSEGQEYYHCNDCNSYYSVFRPKMAHCKYCESKNVSLITKDEYLYSLQNDPEKLKAVKRSENENELLYVDPNLLTHPQINPESRVQFKINRIHNG